MSRCQIAIHSLVSWLSVIAIVGFLALANGAWAQTTLTIPGNQSWTDTGIDLTSGESVTITATGTIYVGALSAPFTQYDYEGPPGSGLAEPGACADLAGGSMSVGIPWPLNGVPCWSLIGSIGSPGNNPFEVGASASFTAPGTGRLYLEPNDNNLGDNSGSWTATIGSNAPPSGIGPAGGTVNPQGTSAEPISTGNGNYYYHHVDFAIPGRGMPLMFQRSYNSLDNYAGPLGANWTYTYNVTLTPTSTGAVIKWGDGHGETYTLSGGVYVPPPGVFNTLVKNNDGTFTLTQESQTRYNFNAAGRLSNITDRKGNQILLTYNGSGNLSHITGAGGRMLVLTYDANSRITSITDPAGGSVSFSYNTNDNLVRAVDPAGGVTTYAYDSSHHVTSITLPNGNTLLQNTYDSQGRVISQTNGRGFTWSFVYDTPSAGQTTVTDPLGNKTVHTYDSSLRIVRIADALGGNVSYTYDANNDRTSVTNQNGKTTLFTYDGKGNITGITDPLGNASAFTHDADNDLLSATNPRGETTSFSYDAHGNLTGIQDTLGDSTAFTYDGYGELVSKQDARGNTTSFAYDGSGDLTEIMDPLGDTTNLGYDAIGRLVSVTDANGHTATASYDALSRLTSVADPLGDQTQFAYDAVGELTGITDANNHSTQYDYDAVGNLLTVTDALGHVTHYAYDADNNRVSFTNANGAVTSYIYDALNRLGQAADPLGFVTSYVYDGVGNVTAMTDPNGNTNQFAYDALDRLVSIAYADGSSVAYSYDADGNRTAMTDSHGTTTYSYNALDRLTAVSSPEGTVGYAYDPVGNRASLTYPDGKVVTYSYDAANRLARVRDWHGRTTRYRYDAAGNLRHISYPNSAAVAFKYDSANRLVKVHNKYAGPATPIRNFFYTLDPVGNRVKVTNGVGVNTRYVYDVLNELIKVRRRHKVIKFTYDAVGNRLTMVKPKTSVAYSYDADDRLLTAGSTTFTYDPNGNRITETTPSGTMGYTYDDANRLTMVSGGGANSVFTYDGDGNRIARNGHPYVNDVAGVLTQVLQGQQGGKLATYIRGLGLISESGRGFNRFYQYDGLGSVVGLTNKGGALKERYNYNAWGKPAPIPLDRVGRRNPFRFTGEALDPGTGLYYLRARYYDPLNGRFISADRFPGFTDKPISESKYLYVFNNPQNFTDPSGNFTGVDDAFALIGGGLAGFAGQYASDVAQNVATGKTGWAIIAPTSSWKAYAVSTVGGAATGEAVLYCSLAGPVGAGACAAAGNAATQLAKNYVLNQNTDWGGLAFNSLAAGLTAGVLDTFPDVPGRLPTFAGRAFFIGAHAQRVGLNAALDVGSAYLADLAKDEIYAILARQQDAVLIPPPQNGK